MEPVIEGFGAQIRFALQDDSVPTQIAGPFDSIEVAAMGGSALAWDVLAETLGHQLDVPIRIHRDYQIGRVSEGALGIACSFSGNTEETLSAHASLSEQCRSTVVIAAGGELLERARSASQPTVVVPREREPADFQPRCAVGYVLTYAARIVEAAGLSTGLTDTIAEALADYESVDVRADAERMAAWLEGGIPIIYAAAARERSVARTMKIKINENAKYPAFAGALPEINHNEMIGFEASVAPFRLLYMADRDDSESIARRFEILSELFAERGLSHIETRRYQVPGETALGRVLAASTFGDWCSHALALARGIDPTPVDLIEEFKAKLGG